jgi:hypothetical protein
VPSVVPPLVHEVGSVPGPNTVKVIVAVALVPEDPVMVEETAEPEMAVPAVPVAGPLAVKVGLAAATTVSLMPEAQAEAAALLLASPGDDAYHQ